MQVLNRLARTHGVPNMLVSDNGPEFRSEALDQWAHDHHGLLHFIDPGKPVRMRSRNASMDDCGMNA